MITKRRLILDFDQVLSLDLVQSKKTVEDDSFIWDAIERRKVAKQNKDFQLADMIRDELLQQGIRLIDSREGTTYEIIE